MRIVPIHPSLLEEPLEAPPEQSAEPASEKSSHADVDRGASRRTLGVRKYARRTLGKRGPGSRRTLGFRKFTRRTLMPRVRI